MKGKTGLTRRRVLGGIVTVGTGSAALGAGTMAYFTDSESSTGNDVTAGALTLGFGGSASFSFSTTLAPTEQTSDSVTLVSDGSLSGSLDVDFDYSESDTSGNDTDVSAQDVAENLEVTALTYDGSDHRDQIDTSNSPPTLHDLATNAHGSGETTQNDLINLSDPGSSGTDFTIELRLKDVGNDFQSDGVAVDVTFYLNQNDSQ